MKNDFLTKFFKPPHPVPRQIVGKPPVLPTNPFELSPFGYILLFFVSVLYQKFLTSHTKRLSLIFAGSFNFELIDINIDEEKNLRKYIKYTYDVPVVFNERNEELFRHKFDEKKFKENFMRKL
ncbi:hypothetical protein HK099_002678 [Clydaea vesicula]|uniref:Uncharacterized protein n=1 Tax=Clydaea vesicula TaxID=447962 RepID=A0AAD5Y0N4_9FUNG|nr:hypothetical protein HK099_002678 [Clydaea vesicula]